MCIAIACAIGLILYQRHVVAQTGSVAVERRPDALPRRPGHQCRRGRGDRCCPAQLGWILADPLIAIAVAGVMLCSAWAWARKSFNQLMDRELPDAERARICAIAHAPCRGAEPARPQDPRRGPLHLHPVASRAGSRNALAEAHAVSDAVEQALLRPIPAPKSSSTRTPRGWSRCPLFPIKAA